MLWRILRVVILSSPLRRVAVRRLMVGLCVRRMRVSGLRVFVLISMLVRSLLLCVRCRCLQGLVRLLILIR